MHIMNAPLINIRNNHKSPRGQDERVLLLRDPVPEEKRERRQVTGVLCDVNTNLFIRIGKTNTRSLVHWIPIVYCFENRLCKTWSKQTATQYISGEWQGWVAIAFRTYSDSALSTRGGGNPLRGPTSHDGSVSPKNIFRVKRKVCHTPFLVK